MRIHSLLIAALAVGVTACAKKEEAPPPADETPPAVTEETPDVQVEEPMKPMLDEATDLEAFIKHMHEHADKIDAINFALADADLAGAMESASWLSTHEDVAGIPTEWLPFVQGMREQAKAVEASGDLEAARAAAKGITANCQGCHVAAGIVEP